MMKILIVEDEPIVARMYQRALKEGGLENIITAVGGREGLAKAKNELPDVILLDVMMPEPNGIQVLEELKANEKTKHIPVIMLTNLSGKSDIELAMKKGADNYWVKKELEITDLVSRLESAVALSRGEKVVETRI